MKPNTETIEHGRLQCECGSFRFAWAPGDEIRETDDGRSEAEDGVLYCDGCDRRYNERGAPLTPLPANTPHVFLVMNCSCVTNDSPQDAGYFFYFVDDSRGVNGRGFQAVCTECGNVNRGWYTE